MYVVGNIDINHITGLSFSVKQKNRLEAVASGHSTKICQCIRTSTVYLQKVK